jgi:hypothetical protein
MKCKHEGKILSWRPGYLKRHLANNIPRFNSAGLFPVGPTKEKGLHKALHHWQPQRKHSPGDFSHACGHTYMYSNPSVYEQSVYEFSLIWDAQINTCFSVYEPIFAYASFFLLQTECCSWRLFWKLIFLLQVFALQAVLKEGIKLIHRGIPVFANLEHTVQLYMDARCDHFQHLMWLDAVSLGVRYALTTFDHHQCIKSAFIANGLGHVTRGSPVSMYTLSNNLIFLPSESCVPWVK